VAGAAAHIGEDDVGLAIGKDGEEDVESGIGVDVDFLDIREIVAERAEGFVFRIEVEREKGIWRAWYQSAMARVTPVLPTPPLPPVVKTTRFWESWPLD